jgi:ATP-dependent Clp protease protease subunit
LANTHGQPIEKIHLDKDRDDYMAPEEARAYGMIDAMRDSRPRIIAAPSPPNGAKPSGAKG